MKRICLIVLLALLGVSAQAKSKLEKQLEEHFRIYILDESRRNPGDRVVIKTDRQGKQYASLYYWRNLDHRNPADVICDAYQWMLLGRTTYGKGAQAAFKKHDQLQAIALRYFDLDFTSRKAKRKGQEKIKIVPKHKAKEYMVLTVNRQSMLSKKVDDDTIQKIIDQGRCPSLSGYMDKTWFDQNYMRSRTE